MPLNNSRFKLIYLIIFYFSLISLSYSQQNLKNESDFLEAFKTYTTPSREIIYTHLNKSTYIKGETLGFTTYVFDKKSSKTSLATTNVYVAIVDNNNSVVKSKLIKASNGVASGVIEIDSVFTSKIYTFKAYTNWQRNFKEPNHYEQTIRVIDPKIETYIEDSVTTTSLDIQFLPESGHAIYDAKNTFGIIVKDSNGHGVGGVTGSITDFEGNIITSFKLNHLGIGRCTFVPEVNKKYKALIDYQGVAFEEVIDTIKPKGVCFSINSAGPKVFVTFRTNSFTLPQVKQKKYTLVIHNGNDIKKIDVEFNENLEVTKLINSNDLSIGVNIFTLFDAEYNPLLERLYFNYDDTFTSINTEVSKVEKSLDSVSVTLNFKDIQNEKFNNLSISVLPSGTKSYKHHHSILSYPFLQPYVNGYIENVKYYFKNISPKQKYDLDNLLITQGWSSYNWYDIFNNPPKKLYSFDLGVSFRATVNTKKSNKYLVYPLKDGSVDFFEINKNENMFQKFGMFPTTTETLKISEVKSSHKLLNPKLFVQFYPSVIPEIDFPIPHLGVKTKTIVENLKSNVFYESNLNKMQNLDSVFIDVKKTRTRTQQLKNKSLGNIFVVDDKARRHSPKLALFLNKIGVKASDNFGTFTINGSSQSGPGIPTVYLDDMELLSFGFLSMYTMDVIDYIEVKRSGIGQGIRGGTGRVIKIYTDPFRVNMKKENDEFLFNSYAFPVAFNTQKTFYVPKYQYYQNSFFKEYGVIDWYGEKHIDANKQIKLTFLNKGTDDNVNLYIEGIANDGEFISEVKTIVIEN